jgi:hypothetical protein
MQKKKVAAPGWEYLYFFSTLLDVLTAEAQEPGK